MHSELQLNFLVLLGPLFHGSVFSQGNIRSLSELGILGGCRVVRKNSFFCDTSFALQFVFKALRGNSVEVWLVVSSASRFYLAL